MDRTNENAEPAQASDRSVRSEKLVKKSGRFVRTVKFVTAIDAWKRQVGHLKRRGSFPLLREVAKNRLTHSKVLIPTDHIADEFITKSLWGHKLIFATSLLTFLYSCYRFVIGLALAFRFGMPFNLWLWLSISMMIVTGFQMMLSYRVHTAMEGERSLRLKESSQGTRGLDQHA